MGNELYLTETEIQEIEQLGETTIFEYVSDLPQEKRNLVMKQFEKERAIRFLTVIATEAIDGKNKIKE